MEEKTTSDWEKEKTGSTSKSTENRPPVFGSGRVDDRPNRTEIDSTEIGYEPFGRVDNRQSRERIDEQREPLERRQLTERESDFNSDEETIEEVE